MLILPLAAEGSILGFRQGMIYWSPSLYNDNLRANPKCWAKGLQSLAELGAVEG